MSQGDNDFIGGDQIIVGDIYGSYFAIGRGAQMIVTQALSAAEEAAKRHALESQLLSQAVSIYAEKLSGQIPSNGHSQQAEPYKSLLPYRLADAPYFFGRDRAKKELLRSMTSSSRGRLVVLHSESGAGKTSMLQAGLAAELLARNHLPLYVRSWRTSPSLAIKQALLPDLQRAPELARIPLRAFLLQVTDILGADSDVFILLDQFEEFFIRIHDETIRHEFIDELAQCLEDDVLRVHFVLSLRKDQFANLADFRSRLSYIFDNEYALKLLTYDEAREAITAPAQMTDLAYEPGLVDEILAELETKTEQQQMILPAQLQLVCWALYRQLDETQQTITHATFQQMEGVAGILRNYLRRVIEWEIPPRQREQAQRVVEALVRSDRTRDLRSESELRRDVGSAETLPEVLGHLVSARLLRVVEDSSEEEAAYELAHDYLVQQIELDPEVLARKAAQELLDQEVEAWLRNPAFRIDDEKLKIIKAQEKRLNFTPEARKLYDLSKAKQRRQRMLLWGLLGGIILIAWIASIFFQRSVTFQQERDQAAIAAKAAEDRKATAEIEADAAEKRQATAEAAEATAVARQAQAEQSEVQALAAEQAAKAAEQLARTQQAEAEAAAEAARQAQAAAEQARAEAEQNEAAAQVAEQQAREAEQSAQTQRAEAEAAAEQARQAQAAAQAAAAQAEAARAQAEAARQAAEQAKAEAEAARQQAEEALDEAEARLAEVNAEATRIQGELEKTEKGLHGAERSVFINAYKKSCDDIGDPYYSPNALASDGSNIWVVSFSRITILRVFDCFPKELPEPLGIDEITYAGGYMWATDQSRGVLYRISITDTAIFTSTNLWVYTSPIYAEGAIWVGGFKEIHKVDPANLYVTTYPLDKLTYAEKLVYETGYIYVSDGSRFLRRFNTSINSWEANEIELNTGIGAITWGGGYIWVSSGLNIVKLEASSGNKFGEFPTDKSSTDLVFDGNNIWASFNVRPNSDAIREIDFDDGTKLAKVDIIPEKMIFDGTYLWALENRSATRLPITIRVVGRKPNDLIEDSNFIWITNTFDGILRKLQATTGEQVAQLELDRRTGFSYLSGVTLAGSNIWVVARNTNGGPIPTILWRLSSENPDVREQFPLFGIDSDVSLVYDNNTYIWAYIYKDRRVIRIREANGVNEGFFLKDIDPVIYGDGYIWAFKKGYNQLLRLDPVSGSVFTHTLSISPTEIIYDDNSKSLWLFDYLDSDPDSITTYTQISTRDLDNAITPINQIIWPDLSASIQAYDGTYFWAIWSNTNQSTVFRINSLNPADQVILPVCSFSSDLVYNKSVNSIWVSCYPDGLIQKLSGNIMQRPQTQQATSLSVVALGNDALRTYLPVIIKDESPVSAAPAPSDTSVITNTVGITDTSIITSPLALFTPTPTATATAAPVPIPAPAGASSLP
jgi:hypothetical protein